MGAKEKEVRRGMLMEGIASIALLSSGSISGHFIQLPESICYGLHGTELACERECSRGEDYRLIKLTVTDFKTMRERDVIVECKGHDAARLNNIEHAHGWENDVMNLLEEKCRKGNIYVSFECETLKADKEAEDHIRKCIPKLVGMEAVGVSFRYLAFVIKGYGKIDEDVAHCIRWVRRNEGSRPV